MGKDNTNLRLIWAVALSFLFIVVWGHFFGEKTPPDPKPAQKTESPATDAGHGNLPPVQKISQDAPDLPKTPVIARVVAKDFEIEIDELGRFSQVFLKNKKYVSAPDVGFLEHFKILFGLAKEPVVPEKLPLFDAKKIRPLEVRFQDLALNSLAFSAPYESNAAEILIQDAPGTLVLTQKTEKFTLQKILKIYPDLHYELMIKISSTDPKTAVNFFVSPGERPQNGENYAFNGVILQNENDTLIKISDGDVKELQSVENARFMASVERYFASVFYAPDAAKISAKIDADPKQNPVPYAQATNEISLNGYIGAKDYARLKKIDKNLTNVVEYGLLSFFAKPLFLLLEILFGVVKNWGFAIILLTVIVKIVLYPLTYKGMVGMQKLKDLAPKMKEIQQKYKNDPQKLRASMMELYKKHGANPMGGCLPLLIQIPIFYAIYRVLYNSVELKSAEFIFWIQDLSTLDPYFVLPILMGISMYIQQNVTPHTMTDPMQTRIFKMLPFIFTIFLIFFPAGLVLYWTVNNVLSIAQQLFINRMLAKKSK